MILVQIQNLINRIGGIMASMLTLSVVDCELEPWSGQTKDYKTGICSFSAKHAALRRKGKDWLAQNNVSKWTTYFRLVKTCEARLSCFLIELIYLEITFFILQILL